MLLDGKDKGIINGQAIALRLGYIELMSECVRCWMP